MKYPKTLNVKVENIFGDQDVQITLYSGLTIFVGTNASGKTQTLKKIRDIMRNEYGMQADSFHFSYVDKVYQPKEKQVYEM